MDRPPRFPPLLYSPLALKHYAMALGVLGFNVFIAVKVVSIGASDFSLAMLCIAVMLALYSSYRTVHQIMHIMREWNELLAAWDELDAHMKTRGVRQWMKRDRKD